MKHPFLKLLLLFMALFAINILVFAGLNRLGFDIGGWDSVLAS